MVVEVCAPVDEDRVLALRIDLNDRVSACRGCDPDVLGIDAVVVEQCFKVLAILSQSANMADASPCLGCRDGLIQAFAARINFIA